MSWFRPQSILDKVFEVSVLIKGVEGVLEAVGGIVILLVGAEGIRDFSSLIAGELSDDSHNAIANLILNTGNHVAAGGTTFLVAYLLIHGLIKIVAVGSLLRNQLWGYPFSMVTLGIFMLYQVYQVYVHSSLFLVVLTLFDVFLMWLIWREYQFQRQKLGASSGRSGTATASGQ